MKKETIAKIASAGALLAVGGAVAADPTLAMHGGGPNATGPWLGQIGDVYTGCEPLLTGELCW